MTKKTLQEARDAFYQAFKARIEPKLEAIAAAVNEPCQCGCGGPKEIVSRQIEERLTLPDTAKRLATATTRTVIQYAEALYPGNEAKQAAVLAEPLLAQRWPIVRPRKDSRGFPGERWGDADQAYVDLSYFARGESGAQDVTPRSVARALRDSGDSEAALVASLVEQGLIPVVLDPSPSGASLEATSLESLGVTADDILEGASGMGSEAIQPLRDAGANEAALIARLVELLELNRVSPTAAETAMAARIQEDGPVMGPSLTPVAIRRRAKHARVHHLTAHWNPAAVATFVLVENLLEQKRKPPALVRTVYSNAIDFHSRGIAFQAPKGQLTFAGRDLAVLEASFDLDTIIKGLSLLGSAPAVRLFRWEVLTGHEQYLASRLDNGSYPFPNIIEIEGGWTGLARRLGLNPDKYTDKLRAIVYAQAHFQFEFPGGSKGNLLSYAERAAIGRDGRAKLTISLGSPLLPGYYAEMPPRERKLVPLLRQEPPLHGRQNEHGPQLTMALVLMSELSQRAAEYAERGSVGLELDDFVRMGDRAGLPRKLVPAVRDLWQRGDARSVPVLEAVAPNRYTLAEPHAAEREFIIETGNRELAGALAGKKSAQKKRAKLRRQGGK